MKYDEIVNALRCVGFSKQCDTCKYSKGYDDNENPNGCDWVQLERDAAAAIESLQAEVKRLELDNEDYEYTLRERYNETITLEQAIDRLHELGWLQEHDRILTEPKRGEWKATEMYMTDECTACGFLMNWEDVPAWLFNLPHFKDRCPNCGAKMTGEQDVE